MNLQKLVGVFKDAFSICIKEDFFQFSATLAYYAVVSLAPLVIFVVQLGGLVFGPEAARARMVGQVELLVGPDGARAIESILENAQNASGVTATVLGVVALVSGLLFICMHLQASLNRLWGVKPDPAARPATAVKRFWSFALLIAIGFLLLVSLVLSAALTALNEYAMSWQPQLVAVWRVCDVLLSFAVVTGLFALMFKYLPDARIAWKDVGLGAVVTALLFTVGKTGIGLYLGNSGIASAYGAAGSVVVLLIWLYYTGLILFYGAAVTRLLAERIGHSVEPAENARPTANRAAIPAAPSR